MSKRSKKPAAHISKTKKDFSNEQISLEGDFPFLIQSLLQTARAELAKEQKDYQQVFQMMSGFPDSIIAQVLLTLAKEQPELSLPLLSVASNHPSPAIVAAVVQALGLIRLPEAGRILMQIEDLIKWDGDKVSISKDLSRSLHRLKSVGIVPTIKKSQPMPAANPTIAGSIPTILGERQFQQALVSNLDGAGNILGILVMRSPGGKYETGVLMFNETNGVNDCRVYSFNQRQLEGFIKEWDLETIGVSLIPVERAFLDYLVAEHLPLNKAKNLPLAPDFVAWRRYFNLSANLTEEDSQPHPIYEKISLESIQESLAFLLPRSEALLQTPEMKNWQIEPTNIMEYAQKLLERRQSRIMVGGSFLQEYKYKLAHEAAEQIFTEEIIRCYSRRLEHMAYVFFLKEQINTARLALAAAWNLQEGKTPLQNPVLMALMLSSLENLANLLESGQPPDNQNTNPLSK